MVLCVYSVYLCVIPFLTPFKGWTTAKDLSVNKKALTRKAFIETENIYSRGLLFKIGSYRGYRCQCMNINDSCTV